MTDYQIDPYKLNEVLQQILDRMASLDAKSNSASPEFQVLMNNYLTKANEAERNQARFEEAVERLDLAEQEAKKLKSETDELKERIRGYERDVESMRIEHQREVNGLRDEMGKVIQAKTEIETVMNDRHGKELSMYKTEAERQISQLQAEMNEVIQLKRKFEEKFQMKSQEADVLEKELNELKVKVADEQAKIREEIIEATKRSNHLEQRFQEEREKLHKRLRELETSNEEISSSLTLKQREIEYKDALLQQAIKQPAKFVAEPSHFSVNKTTFTPSIPIAKEEVSKPIAEEITSIPEFATVGASHLAQANNNTTPQVTTPPVKEKKGIGGIWAKLSPV